LIGDIRLVAKIDYVTVPASCEATALLDPLGSLVVEEPALDNERIECDRGVRWDAVIIINVVYSHRRARPHKR